MGGISAYLIRIVTAALLCSIIRILLGDKGTVGGIGKIMTGLYLAVTVIQPVAELSLENWEDYWDKLSVDASYAVQTGTQLAQDELRSRIKASVEAYILDKAAIQAQELRIIVTLSENDPPVPCSVIVEGALSPAQKQSLTHVLENDLGIPKEAQQWNP